MDYALNHPISFATLGSWKQVFEALSIRNINAVRGFLELPFEISESLNQLAHDFTVANRRLYTGSSDEWKPYFVNFFRKEPCHFKLFGRLTPADLYTQRQFTLFVNMKRELYNICDASSLFDWLIQTRPYSKYANRPRLEHMSAIVRVMRLLERWAHQRQTMPPQPVPDKHPTYTEAVWRMVEQTPYYMAQTSHIRKPTEISLLPLPLKTVDNVRQIVERYRTVKAKINLELDILSATPPTMWDDFALNYLNVDWWIRFEAKDRLQQRLWRSLCEKLSENEYQQFTTWIVDNKAHMPGFKGLPPHL